MGNLQGFNANEVEPTGSTEPLPAGWYTAMIVDSQFKPTKAGTGEYLELTFEVVEGEHQNRKVWARLNLNNPNQTAVDIAQRELSAICRAVGIMTPQDSADLHDKPLSIKVAIRPAGNGYDASNEIKNFAEADGVRPEAQASAAPAATGKKPWQR